MFPMPSTATPRRVSGSACCPCHPTIRHFTLNCMHESRRRTQIEAPSLLRYAPLPPPLPPSLSLPSPLVATSTAAASCCAAAPSLTSSASRRCTRAR